MDWDGKGYGDDVLLSKFNPGRCSIPYFSELTCCVGAQSQMNDETDIDAMMATLTEMLPHTSDDVILDAVLSTGSVEAAYEWITERERQSSIEQNVDQSVLQEMLQLFPFVEKSVITEIVAAFPELEVEELIDTVIIQLIRKRKSKYVKVEERQTTEECETVLDAPLSVKSFKDAIAVAPTVSTKPSSVPKEANNDKEDSKANSFEYDFGVTDQSEVTEEPDYYRELAQDLIQVRGVVYSKAAESFQRGGITGKGYSSYLSEEGSALTSRIDKLNAMAAYAALRKFNPKLSNSRSIDLHGLTVKEAEPLVHSFLRHHLVDNETVSVQIVTGHGRGSSQGARLRPVIYGLLAASRFNFSFDNFAVFTVFRK